MIEGNVWSLSILSFKLPYSGARSHTELKNYKKNFDTNVPLSKSE